MSVCFVLAVCQLVLLLERHGSVWKFYLWTLSCYEVIKQVAAILMKVVSWQFLVTREFKEKTCWAELVLNILLFPEKGMIDELWIWDLELFWDITQLLVVIPYRRFRTTYRSHRQGSRIQVVNLVGLGRKCYCFILRPCEFLGLHAFSSRSF